MVLTLVEPSRSAEAERKAPPEARLRWWSDRASSWRSVVDEPGVEAQLVGDAAASRAGRREHGGDVRARRARGVRPRASRRSRAAVQAARERLGHGGVLSTYARTMPSAAQKHSSRTASPPGPAQRWSPGSQIGSASAAAPPRVRRAPGASALSPSPPVSSASAS